MIRLIVVTLLAINFLLVGFHVASEPSDPRRPVASAVPTIPPGVPPLQLMEELELIPAASAVQCFSAGPFETPQSLQQARERIAETAVSVTERESEALVELGYWVTLTAVDDFAAAGGSMRQLTAAGIHDVAVVGDAQGQFRVSLGYFLDERNARNRRNQARELGFEADTQLQRVTQPRYWLDYSRTGASGEAGLMAAMDTAQAAGGLEREIPCGDQAGP